MELEASTSESALSSKENAELSSEKGEKSSENSSKSTAKENEPKKTTEPIITPKNDLGGALCVFYTKSPFSDFSPNPFILDGKYYYSVEHFFQIQMLYSFGLFKLSAELIKIPDALTFRKTLRNNLKSIVKSGMFEEKTFAKWKVTNAEKMMRKGNKTKFDQNFHLKQLLLHTGDRILVFTNKNDRLLGVGMTETEFMFWIKKNNITLEDILDIFSGTKRRPRELGQNLLGLALMDVRAELCAKTSILAEWRLNKNSGRTEIRPTEAVSDKEKLILCGYQEDIIAHANKEALENFEAPLPPEVAAEIASSSKLREEEEAAASEQTEETTKTGDEKENEENETIKETETKEKESEETEKTVERDVIILTDEKRILLHKRGAEPRVIGDPEELEQRRKKLKQTRFENETESAKSPAVPEPEVTPLDNRERNLSVLERLKGLKFQKPMINPFSVPLAIEPEVTDKIIEEEEAAEMAYVPPQRFKPRGSYYNLEPGEVPPPGVVPPPPGSDEHAILLPMHMRKWIYRPPPVYGKPAGLPAHLLPRPPTPPGVNPLIFHQRFLPQPSYADFDPERGGPLFARKQTIIPINEAPHLPERDNWKLPENPVSKILLKAKNFVKNLEEKQTQDRLNSFDEGATPSSREHYKQDPDDLEIDPIAFDRKIFPFGMEASLGDLHEMGYVPPPIVGDPYAQTRNKPIKESEWLTRFDNLEAALKHHSNRWKKGGRLATTGKFEECDSSDEEETLYGKLDEESDEDTNRPKRNFETQVIYVDTAQYDHYVRWYQKMHGFAPLPNDESVMNLEKQRSWFHYYRSAVQPYTGLNPETLSADGAGPEKLYGSSYGDYFSLARWRWAQWERKVERGEDAELLDLEQEKWTDGVSFAGKAMKYERNNEGNDDETTIGDENSAQNSKVQDGDVEVIEKDWLVLRVPSPTNPNESKNQDMAQDNSDMPEIIETVTVVDIS